jgi:hypothetical protein
MPSSGSRAVPLERQGRPTSVPCGRCPIAAACWAKAAVGAGRRRAPGQGRGRSAGSSSSQLLSAHLPNDHRAPHHSDVSRQLRRGGQLPIDLRWDVGFVGAATLVHLLVVSVSRRRREMGLLKALGFVNSQIVAAVAWQATALVAVGIVVGVPLGIVLGREVWCAFANNLGVVPVSVVPSGLLVAIVAGILAAANLLAVAETVQTTTASPCSVRPDLTR